MLSETPESLILAAAEQTARSDCRVASVSAQDRALTAALMRLDAALAVAIDETERAFDRLPEDRGIRGLATSVNDAAYLLGLVPGRVHWAPLLRHPGSPKFALVEEYSPLTALQRRFNLSSVEIDALLIACSSDLDQRYERLYGLLQDDVTRRRPTLATLIHLTAADKLQQWQGLAHFSSESALLQSGLVNLQIETPLHSTTLGSRVVLPDEQGVRYLTGEVCLDEELAAFCTVIPPNENTANSDSALRRYPALLSLSLEDSASCTLRLHVHGDAQECEDLARALAQRSGMPLLRVDLSRLLARGGDLRFLLRRASLAARLRDAMLLLDGEATDAHASPALLHALTDQLAVAALPCLLSTRTPELAPALREQIEMSAAVPPPDVSRRRELWQRALTTAGTKVDDGILAELAQEFTLSSAQIARAVHAYVAASQTQPVIDTRAILFACIRGKQTRQLPRGVKSVSTNASWPELVLPDDTEALLHELCTHVRQRARVMSDWGFGHLSSRGQGVNVLFSGGAGTGKSTACEVLSNVLNRPMLRAEVPQLVSKYIGETEKQLSEVFDAAEGSGALLVFDEADALFGKRTTVSDAHDRYANIEVSYLLQRVEEFTGVLILTTNLQANIDSAFLRRMQFVVEFPFPDAVQRERIWRIMLPVEAPQDNLDYAELAGRYPIAGGHIRNIALAAAILAAGRGEAIARRHIHHAARREFQKIGKTAPEGGFFGAGGVA